MLNLILWFVGLTLYFFGAIVILVSAREDVKSNEIWPYFFAALYPLMSCVLVIGLCVEDLRRRQ